MDKTVAETFYSKNIANQYYFSYKMTCKSYLRKNEINMSIENLIV